MAAELVKIYQSVHSRLVDQHITVAIAVKSHVTIRLGRG
jgi:hypothetical protein